MFFSDWPIGQWPEGWQPEGWRSLLLVRHTETRTLPVEKKGNGPSAIFCSCFCLNDRHEAIWRLTNFYAAPWLVERARAQAEGCPCWEPVIDRRLAHFLSRFSVRQDILKWEWFRTFAYKCHTYRILAYNMVLINSNIYFHFIH